MLISLVNNKDLKGLYVSVSTSASQEDLLLLVCGFSGRVSVG
jgi:hypothetical protein